MSFLIFLMVFIGIYMKRLYNDLVMLENDITEAYYNIDVYSKKQYNLINNLVGVAKLYTNHEGGTLENIAKLRSCTKDFASDNENNQLYYGLSRIIATYENYPDLKANETFKELTKQLTETEDQLARSIKICNRNVKKLNNKVESFPENIFATILGFKSKSMFSASELNKNNIKIEPTQNK